MRLVLVSIIVSCFAAFGQDQPVKEIRGIPPRASASEYGAHTQVGTMTLAAEFDGHSVPTPEATLTSEEFVVVEAAMFGPPGAQLRLSFEDFSLRINDKKSTISAEQYGLVFASLKDPELEPSKAQQNKSKTSIGGGGGEQDSTPTPVKIPIEVRHAMQQKVQKAALPEGDRPLPAAGLLFFRYRGKTEGIQKVELIYEGPAGKATLHLQRY